MLRKSSLQPFAAVLLGALLLAGCGSGEEKKKQPQPAGAQATERAFLEGMVAHHQSAIEMATIAKQRGQDPFITKLATSIVTAQQSEIAQMKRIHQRLFDSPLKPDMGAHDRLGLSAEQAGMMHSEADIRMLRQADPFDREFVDMMVPHHAGATRMARAVLAKTKDPELRKLAQTIISMQTKEIAEMNSFRTREHGGPVPSQGGGGGHEGGGEGH